MTTQLTAVVTTRNRLDTLRQTLWSVLRQRDVDLRVVVVDNGSSDGTQQFLRSLDHPRIEVVRNEEPVPGEPDGVSTSRNLGLARVTTPWVAYCDDDDLWAPGKSLAHLGALQRAPGCRWAVAGAVLVDGDLRVIGHRRLTSADDLLVRLLAHNVIPATGSGLLFETEFLRELGGYDEGLEVSEDWDLCIRAAGRSPAAVADGPHVAYRIRAGTLSSDSDKMRASLDLIDERFHDLREELGVQPDLAAYERYLADQDLKARRRLSAARRFARLASMRRDPSELARAAIALAAPGALDRRGDLRARKRVPSGWVAEITSWLNDVPAVPRLDDLSRPPSGPGGPEEADRRDR